MALLNPQQIQAAQAFVQATIAALTTSQGVHAETAVAGAARMAGTLLFRSFGFDLAGIPPGQVVLSDAANTQGPQLIQTLGSVLDIVGVAIDHERWNQPVGPEHQPLLAFLETQQQLEPAYRQIQDRLGLTYTEAADAAAAACALLIQQCLPVLDPSIAFSIALYAFVEGAKTAPAPVAALT